MSKFFRSISIDDLYKTTEGTSFNLHNDVLIVGPSGYDGASDTSSLYLGNSDVFLTSTFDDNLSLGATALIFNTSGSESLRIDGSGNVGIGTNNPTQVLDVNGDVLVQGGDLFLVDTNDKISSDGTDLSLHVGGVARLTLGTTAEFSVDTTVSGKLTTTTFQLTTGATDSYVLTSDASGNATWQAPADTTAISDADNDTKIEVEQTADEDIIHFTTAGTERMTIGSTGFVGIGSDTPTQTLDVNGDVLVQGGDLYLVDTNEKIASDGTDMLFHVGGTERVRFEASGAVGIGTNDAATSQLVVRGQANALHLINSGFGNINSEEIRLYMGGDTNQIKSAIIAVPVGTFGRTDMYFCLDSAGDLDNVTSGDHKMVIKTITGNVGIGSNEPTQKLDVNGDAIIQGGDLFLVDTNEKISSDGTDLSLHAGGVERLTIGTTANFAVDTTVAGKTTTTTFQLTTGAADTYILTSDAQGNATWQAPASTSLIQDADSDTKIDVEEIGDEDVIRFYTAGSERMTIGSTGYIGIGTDTSSQLLTIDNASDPFIHINTSGTNRSAIGFQTSSLNGLWIESTTLTAFFTGGANERMRIDASGNVGIGTNNPTQILHVVGTGYITDDLLFDSASVVGTNTTDGSDNAYLVLSGGGADGAGRGGRVVLSGNERTTFGGSVEIASGAGVDDNIRFLTNSDTERVRITSGGNVGIGTNNPTQTLDVNGDALVQGGNLFLVDTDNYVFSDGTDVSIYANALERMTLGATANITVDTYVQGNLTVNGSMTYLSSETIEVEDCMIALGATNTADTLDLGFYGTYNDGSQKYAGLIRDASDTGIWHLFESTVEPGTTSLSSITDHANLHLRVLEVESGIGYNGDLQFLAGGVSGAETVRIESSTGNVGIGTNDPSQKLDVNGDALIQGGDLFLVDTDDKISSDGTDLSLHVGGVERFTIGTTANLAVDTTVSGKTTTTTFQLTTGAADTYILTSDAQGNATWQAPASTSLIQDADNDTKIDVEEIGDEDVIHFYTAGTERMTIGATGFVGIGSDNPTQTLDVNGDSLIQGGDLYLVDTNEKIASDGTDMFFHVNGSEVVRFKDGGNVGIGSNNPTQTLDVNGDALVQGGDLYLVDTNEKIASDGTDMFFHVGGSEVVRFEATGDVGIGTNNPIQMLDVNGDAYVRGNLRTLVTSVTTSTTLDHTHSVIVCDASAGGFTITLPVSHDGTAEPNFKGSIFHIIKTDSSANLVTVQVSGSDVLDGSASSINLNSQDDRLTVINAGGASSVGRWYSI